MEKSRTTNSSQQTKIGMPKLLEFTIALLMVLVIVFWGYQNQPLMYVSLALLIASIIYYIHEFKVVYKLNHKKKGSKKS